MEKEKDLKKNTMHVAALVLGIISIVGAGFWYIGIPTGVLGIVLGIKSVRKLGSKLGKAGMITGIVGLSMTAFLQITFILFILLEEMYYY